MKILQIVSLVLVKIKDYNTFVNDRVYFNAIAMSVLQIGELANGLSDEFKNATSNEIPWRMIRGMRNVLAHAYGDIDEDALWATIINDIPIIQNFCNSYLSVIKSESNEKN